MAQGMTSGRRNTRPSSPERAPDKCRNIKLLPARASRARVPSHGLWITGKSLADALPRSAIRAQARPSLNHHKRPRDPTCSFRHQPKINFVPSCLVSSGWRKRKQRSPRICARSMRKPRAPASTSRRCARSSVFASWTRTSGGKRTRSSPRTSMRSAWTPMRRSQRRHNPWT